MLRSRLAVGLGLWLALPSGCEPAADSDGGPAPAGDDDAGAVDDDTRPDDDAAPTDDDTRPDDDTAPSDDDTAPSDDDATPPDDDSTPPDDDTTAADDDTTAPVPDADHDGYDTPADCDDGDPGVHPGAEESCDGRDEDCDGEVDEDAVDPLSWYGDADGDGWGSGEVVAVACEGPPGTAASATDCDDAAPTVRPGGPEQCGNDVDDDCDGEVDADCCARGVTPLADVRTAIVGGACCDAPRLGTAIAGAGDADGDGAADVLLGQAGVWATDRGRALLFLGPLPAGDIPLSARDAVWIGDDAGEEVGKAVAFSGDSQGDGRDRILIARPRHPGYHGNSGVAIAAADGPGTFFEDDLAKLTLNGDHSETGESLAPAGDVDGDGLDDVLVGAPNDATWARDAGAVFLVAGPLPETHSTSLISGSMTRFWSPYDHHGFGRSVAGVGDVDGDGTRDVLVGAAPWTTYLDVGLGVAYLFLGPVAPGRTTADVADTIYLREAWDDLDDVVVAAADDVDQDGIDDFLVGMPGRDGDTVDSGRVYLFLGPPDPGLHSLGEADAWFDGRAAGDRLGTAIAAGDLTGDGVPDLAIGAPGARDGGTGGGAVYVFEGPLLTGGHAADDAQVAWYGEVSGDQAGFAVSIAGDLGGTQAADLLIGAPLNSEGGASAGKVYVVTRPSDACTAGPE